LLAASPDAMKNRVLARAHRWTWLIEDRTYRSAAEIAEAESVDRSFVNRLLRLTLLAPDVQEAILGGRQPKAMHSEDLTRAMPSAWEEQRSRLIALVYGCGLIFAIRHQAMCLRRFGAAF
jgi:hypothetical protein